MLDLEIWTADNVANRAAVLYLLLLDHPMLLSQLADDLGPRTDPTTDPGRPAPLPPPKAPQGGTAGLHSRRRRGASRRPSFPPCSSAHWPPTGSRGPLVITGGVAWPR
ncbi:MAG: hypothetical protein ACRDTX_14455 [Pseudonocardiaceae bacterium]